MDPDKENKIIKMKKISSKNERKGAVERKKRTISFKKYRFIFMFMKTNEKLLKQILKKNSEIKMTKKILLINI